MTDSLDPLRPIVGISMRTPQEVFDIMADRIRLAHTVPGDVYQQIGFVSWKEGEGIEIWNPESFHDYDITDDDRAHGYTSSPIYIRDEALSTSPVIDTNEGLAERVRELEEELERFRRPDERMLSTDDAISVLPGFMPRHLLGLALLFRSWSRAELWGRPQEAELAARQVETAYVEIVAARAALDQG